MAQPTNAVTSSDISATSPEDLMRRVTRLAPLSTPVFSAARMTRATQTKHEWMTDKYAKAADNAQIEGDDYTGEAQDVNVRLDNYTQILSKEITVSETTTSTVQYTPQSAGAGAHLRNLIHKRTVELKLDTEKMLLDNRAKSAGSSSAPRRSAGIPTWLKGENTLTNGNGADPSTSDGANARTDATADAQRVKFSEDDIKKGLQYLWTATGMMNKKILAVMSPSMLTVASDFEGNIPRRNNNRTGEVSSYIDVYTSPFGAVLLTPSNQVRANDIIMIDPMYLAVATLRPTRVAPIGKTGDSQKRLIVHECTLQAVNPEGLFGIFDRKTS